MNRLTRRSHAQSGSGNIVQIIQRPSQAMPPPPPTPQQPATQPRRATQAPPHLPRPYLYPLHHGRTRRTSGNYPPLRSPQEPARVAAPSLPPRNPGRPVSTLPDLTVETVLTVNNKPTSSCHADPIRLLPVPASKKKNNAQTSSLPPKKNAFKTPSSILTLHNSGSTSKRASPSNPRVTFSDTSSFFSTSASTSTWSTSNSSSHKPSSHTHPSPIKPSPIKPSLLSSSSPQQSLAPPCPCPNCASPFAWLAHARSVFLDEYRHGPSNPHPSAARAEMHAVKPLSFLAPLSAHVNELYAAGVEVGDIVRELHSTPELVKYRTSITEEGVWDALRRGWGGRGLEREMRGSGLPSAHSGSQRERDGEKGSERDLARSGSARSGSLRSRTGLTGDFRKLKLHTCAPPGLEVPTLLPPRGMAFESLCAKLWIETDAGIPEIVSAVRERGFECEERDVVKVLKKRGMKGGLALGAEGKKKFDAEAMETVRRGLNLGMGDGSCLEFLREEGFGGWELQDVRNVREIYRGRR